MKEKKILHIIGRHLWDDYYSKYPSIQVHSGGFYLFSEHDKHYEGRYWGHY